MIDLEKCALIALHGATMRIASSGKRFRRDISYRLEQDPDYKLTERQALYLWSLIYTYRRQVRDKRLIDLCMQRKLLDVLPDGIYLPGDLREPIKHSRQFIKKARLPICEPIPPPSTETSQFPLF